MAGDAQESQVDLLRDRANFWVYFMTENFICFGVDGIHLPLEFVIYDIFKKDIAEFIRVLRSTDHGYASWVKQCIQSVS